MKGLLLILLLAVLIWLTRPWDHLPPAWNPWVPLALDQEITPVSRFKLARLKGERQRCLNLLETAPEGQLDHMPLEDYTPVENCPLTNVVRVQSTGVEFNAPYTASCPLVVSWLMFERQQLQRLARKHLGTSVARVYHYGTFACRNIYNREDARRSEHATASALDVAAFRLEDGRRVSVLDDWENEEEPAKSEFLKAVHNAACSYFGTVLGPDYNQPHENHFHFDTSNFGVCR